MTPELVRLVQWIHIRAQGGGSVCGQPAKQEHIRCWGTDLLLEEQLCPHCVRVYSLRAACT